MKNGASKKQFSVTHPGRANSNSFQQKEIGKLSQQFSSIFIDHIKLKYA